MMQKTLFELDAARSGELQDAIDLVAAAGIEERGAVFTRRAVVEFILDLAGYRADTDLLHYRLLEPSCGRGDFLLVALARLLDAYQRTGGKIEECALILRNAVRAVELHHATFLGVQARIRQFLLERGVPPTTAEDLVAAWLVQDDFLLCQLPSDFTHIVGNPPYVRLERIPEALLHEYRARYRTVYDRADLYVPFIERSLSLLASHGRLAFICSDRWLKNRYGGPLRKIIAKDFHLEYYVDMTGTDAFHAAVTAYPAIVVIAAGKGTTTQVVRKPDLNATSLQLLAERLRAAEQSGHVDIEYVTEAPKGMRPWVLSATTDEQRLLHHLEHEFPLLEAAGCQVGIGAATGCDRVYIGRPEALAVEADRKVPLVMTQDIRTGVIRWSGNVIINTFTEAGELVPLTDYPQLAGYLALHEQTLRARHVAKKNHPKAWYRTIDRIHSGLRERPKLLIPDIKAKANVVYDEGLYYPHHNLYYVTSTTWDLRALQAVLRSHVAQLFVAAYSIRMRAGYLRFQAQYVRHIHVPDWATIPDDLRSRLRDAAIADDVGEINEATCEAYQLSSADRALILRAASTPLASGRNS
jgi:hypothetical protein